MKLSAHPCPGVQAFRCDEAFPGGVDRCGLCRRYRVEFVASAGLRAIASLPERERVCVNADGPCLMALKAKKWLDALMGATR